MGQEEERCNLPVLVFNPARPEMKKKLQINHGIKEKLKKEEPKLLQQTENEERKRPESK
jgi:hypothetical protein